MDYVSTKHVQRIILEKIDGRIKERIIDHNKRGKNSHILKYSREDGHSQV